MPRCPAQWPAVAIIAFCLAVPAFAQAEVPDRLVIEDFEDVSTWRARPGRGVSPDAWFSGDLFLASSDLDSRHGSYVGELRYRFAGAPAGGEMTLEKERASRLTAFIDAIEFDANPKGKDLSLSFDLEDSAGHVFRTSAVPLQGDGWKTFRLDLNAQTVPKFAEISFPAIIRKLRFGAKAPDSGSIFLDDLALVGRVSRAQRLGVVPATTTLHILPGQTASLAYRVRNATARDLSGKLAVELRDITGGPARAVAAAFVAPARGEVLVPLSAGVLPPGSYSARVDASAGDLAATCLDFVAVFTPNGRRLNRSPMWFGIQDYITWQGEVETRLHREWMKLLGADLVRIGLAGANLQPKREDPACPPALGRMLDDLGSAGIDALFLYTDAFPAWTKPEPAWKGPATDLAALAEHASRVGAALAGHPNVKYLEFWNEPDLEFFKGTLEQYLGLAEAFAPAFKKAAPGIKVVSGGVTVLHPAEKKGFSGGMFHRADLFDIAGFHSHGSVADYARRQRMVEDWMAEKGHSLRVANTEAGSRSVYDIPGALQQAVTLVQKIGYAKSRANSEFYSWFTLQDYWDMDSWADDSFGLVTCDNRPKPSFVAYNELIRRLANTRPLGDVELGSDLVAYAFVDESDGTVTYLCWPRPGKASARLSVSSKGDYTRFDLFGREQSLATSAGPALLVVDRFPVYLKSSLADDRLALASAAETFFDAPEFVSAATSGQTLVPVTVRNRAQAPARLEARVLDTSGEELGRAGRPLAPGAEAALEVPLRLAADTHFQSQDLALVVASDGASPRQVTLPLTVRRPYPVRHLADPRGVSDTPLLRLDRQEDVHELAYDPFRPKWGGPADLSLDAHFAHDGRDLIVFLAVTDSQHVQTQAPDQLWKQDSIQIAFQNEQGVLTELALGLSNAGPAVWCHEASDPKLKGRWEVSADIRREGTVTTYRVRLPLAKLGLAAPAAGKTTSFRFAFVVNNDNGQGRIRVMEWFGGIAQRKNPQEFGFGRLE